MAALTRSTEEELKRVVELREAGHAYTVIAERMGLSEQAARNRYLRSQGRPLRRRKGEGALAEAMQPALSEADELPVHRRNGETLPPNHPETWGAIMATFSPEWRTRYLDV